MRLSHAVLGSVIACSVVKHAAHAQTATVHGIRFVVDTSPELTPLGPGPVKPLGLQVTYATGRGRVDVLAKPVRPRLKLGEVIVASSLAIPGDYYLFDSTGFVLVRPATREFVAFEISDASFNYEARRDGWPQFFRIAPTRVDTLADSSSVILRPHGEHRMYWHLDVVRDTSCELAGCSIEVIARGRATLPDAPVTETVVARWFGPAQALAHLPGGIARLIGKPLRVTTVSPLTGVHRLRDLRTMLIDPASLTLPKDYRQARWSDFTDALPLPAERVARWLVPPGR